MNTKNALQAMLNGRLQGQAPPNLPPGAAAVASPVTPVTGAMPPPPPGAVTQPMQPPPTSQPMTEVSATSRLQMMNQQRQQQQQQQQQHVPVSGASLIADRTNQEHFFKLNNFQLINASINQYFSCTVAIN